jgi:hypothetical protein
MTLAEVEAILGKKLPAATMDELFHEVWNVAAPNCCNDE